MLVNPGKKLFNGLTSVYGNPFNQCEDIDIKFQKNIQRRTKTLKWILNDMRFRYPQYEKNLNKGFGISVGCTNSLVVVFEIW